MLFTGVTTLGGFHHRFHLHFFGLQTLFSLLLGDHFMGVVGDVTFGFLVVGPISLMVWAWTCPYSATLIHCQTLIVAIAFTLLYAISK